MRDTERGRGGRKQATCREPNAELDPETPGSHPGSKAGVKPLSHPGIPFFSFLLKFPSPPHAFSLLIMILLPTSL